MTTINLEILIDRLDQACQLALEKALSKVQQHHQCSVEVAHWLLELLLINEQQWNICKEKFIPNMDILIQSLTKQVQQYPEGIFEAATLSQSIIDLSCEAWLISSLEANQPVIAPAFVLLAILQDVVLKQEMTSKNPLLKLINVNELKAWSLSQISHKPPINNKEKSQLAHTSQESTLDKYTQDLTALAKQNKFDPIVGRNNEIYQMIDILLRRRQNNPILVGEPGVGKTACVEGLAQMIVSNQVPKLLQNVRLLSLDLTALKAGASIKGEFEKRLKSVIEEAQQAEPKVVLFIDEAHLLIGSAADAGVGDAANILKPALARGQLRTITATTWREYKKYFEKDAALVRRFQAVKIDEPSHESTYLMLQNLKEKLESHHGLSIDNQAIASAIQLTHKYLPERKLPDKAISILDTACAKQVSAKEGTPYPILTLQNELEHLNIQISNPIQQDNFAKEVEELKQKQQALIKELEHLNHLSQQQKQLLAGIENCDDIKKQKVMRQELQKLYDECLLIPSHIQQNHIAEVLAEWTGIPAEHMLTDIQSKIIDLESNLNSNIYGQKDGLHQISQSLITSSVGLSKSEKPLGVFLLAGPSGVGKTETAITLSKALLGSTDKMLTINMSNFKEAHKVSTLIGSPPGYVGFGEGGILTEFVRRQPHSLILFDEIEKAHESFQDMLYQLLDRGVMRDSEGLEVDFKQTIIMMTSNAADHFITENADQLALEANNKKVQSQLHQILEKHFKAAFLGRVNVIPYMPLSADILHNIIKVHLDKLIHQAADNHKVVLTYQGNVVQTIVEQCHRPEIGARQVRHYLEQQIAPAVAKWILLQKSTAAKQITMKGDIVKDEQWIVKSLNSPKKAKKVKK